MFGERSLCPLFGVCMRACVCVCVCVPLGVLLCRRKREAPISLSGHLFLCVYLRSVLSSPLSQEPRHLRKKGYFQKLIAWIGLHFPYRYRIKKLKFLFLLHYFRSGPPCLSLILGKALIKINGQLNRFNKWYHNNGIKWFSLSLRLFAHR